MQELTRYAGRLTSALATYAEAAKGYEDGDYLLSTGGGMRAVNWRASPGRRPAAGEKRARFRAAEAKIRVQRDDLVRLDAVLNEPHGYTWIRTQVHMTFLPDFLLEWAVHGPPKGLNKRRWPLKRVLPLAFWSARMLLELAKTDLWLGRRVQECVEDDRDALAYWQRFQDDGELALIVALVDRAFRGAWERCGLRRPILSDPREALRSHYYGLESRRRRRALEAIKRLDPAWQEAMLSLAKKLLLGLPGEAARNHGLLT